jgi:hypothetical protein
MRRELPTHPHIDHLKKQAKDLLDAYQNGDPEALARIVALLPAFAGRTIEEAARLPFALHDAQSTIAREYGFPSWKELRAEVERRASAAQPESALRALIGRPLPAAVTAALGAAWASREEAQDVAASEPPRELPLVAFRDAFLMPGAVAPIALGRPSSLAAVDAAAATTARLLAVFSQRDPQTAEPGFDQMHAVGCVALIKERVAADGATFIVVQGLRWVSLEALDPPGARGFAVARVTPFQVLEGPADDTEREALAGGLRDRARRLAAAMPQAERVIALIDSIREPQRLSDLIVANMPCRVADKVEYASEPSLAQRLRKAIALCDAQLAAPPK